MLLVGGIVGGKKWLSCIQRSFSKAMGHPVKLLLMVNNKPVLWLLHGRALEEKNEDLFIVCARYHDVKKNYSYSTFFLSSLNYPHCIFYVQSQLNGLGV